VLLGLGEDGHTASIFPDDLPGASGKDSRVWARAARGPSPYPERVTLTLGALASARHVVFLVSGGAKAGIVTRILSGDGEDLPAARLARRARRTTWLLDAEAASALHS
jgi:6-phosphogluconolactonase